MFSSSIGDRVLWRFEGRGSFTYITGGNNTVLVGDKAEEISVPCDDHAKGVI